MGDNFYKNHRVVFNSTTGLYELCLAYYDNRGELVDLIFQSILGRTLSDAKETLEGLISDIENWEHEEIRVSIKNKVKPS